MKKKISILGSTGSIGLSALDIVDKKRNLFNIDLLSANSNYKLISKQIKKYKPKIFVVKDKIIFKIDFLMIISCDAFFVSFS